MTAGARKRELLRTAPPPLRAVEWAAAAIGASAASARVEALSGGMSHANHVIQFAVGPGANDPPLEVVLRRWVNPDWQIEDPEFSPRQEAATYALLATTSVPAPRLLAADPDASGCDVPALLLSRVRGNRSYPADAASFAEQLAQALAIVHATDPPAAARTVPPYRPYYEADRLAVPVWTRRPDLWRSAIAVFAAPRPAEAAAFIHRDYHQGNTLWSAGRLTAIVDWTSAEWGPPSVDVAHMRFNLAMSYSLEVADAFLEACRAAGVAPRYQTGWDIVSAVDCLPELPFPGREPAELERLEEFVAAALRRL